MVSEVSEAAAEVSEMVSEVWESVAECSADSAEYLEMALLIPFAGK